MNSSENMLQYKLHPLKVAPWGLGTPRDGAKRLDEFWEQSPIIEVVGRITVPPIPFWIALLCCWCMFGATPFGPNSRSRQNNLARGKSPA